MLWKKKAGKFPDSQTTRRHHRRLRWILCLFKFSNCGFKTETSLKILSLFLAFSGPGCTGGHSGWPWWSPQPWPVIHCPASPTLADDPERSWLARTPLKDQGLQQQLPHVTPRVGNRSRHQQMLHSDVILGSVLPFCTWSPYSAPTAMQAGATFTAQAVFTLRQTSIFS